MSSRTLRREVLRNRMQQELSKEQRRVVSVMARIEQPATLSSIASSARRDRSTVATALTRLRRKGWVVREARSAWRLAEPEIRGWLRGERFGGPRPCPMWSRACGVLEPPDWAAMGGAE